MPHFGINARQKGYVNLFLAMKDQAEKDHDELQFYINWIAYPPMKKVFDLLQSARQEIPEKRWNL